MDENVCWVLELAVEPGRREDFSALMRDMVAAAGCERGTLNYEWSISSDGTVCHVYVRYLDSAAVMTHMRGFGDRFSSRFLALAKITRMTVYGAPSAEVMHALAPYGATYLAPYGGFRR